MLSKTKSLHRLFHFAAFCFFCASAETALSQIEVDTSFSGLGYTQIPFVSEKSLSEYRLKDSIRSKSITALCHRLDNKFPDYKWTESACGQIKWNADYKSHNGSPLLYRVFGKGKNTTLILGGVHPDELTPIHLAFKFARYLEKNPAIYKNKDIRIVIAPLVNPDGFLRQIPSRTNSNGVDVNRNFLTLDWYDKAISTWRKRRQGNKRYFPGYFPNTEIETLFQVGLIDMYHPGKIISIHAPLGFLDYDGPGDQKPRPNSKIERLAKGLVVKMSETSRNYRVVDYSFYPGSLGNFAGNERELATITLELETANPKRTERYWKKFLPSLILSVQHPFLVTGQNSQMSNPRLFKQYQRSKIDSPKG